MEFDIQAVLLQLVEVLREIQVLCIENREIKLEVRS